MKESAAITGVAGSFPGADGLADFWRRVQRAEVAPLRPVRARWPSAASAPGGDEHALFALGDPPGPAGSRQVAYGRAVIGQAMQAAFPDGSERPPRERTALVVATTGAPEPYFEADAAAYWHGADPPDLPAVDPSVQLDLLADGAGIGDVRIAVDAACASSLYAVNFAVALLREGSAQAVVVLGLNISMPDFIFAGFARLGALSSRHAVLPFSADASGLVLGEAAAAIVLEPSDRPLRAGRSVLATVAGIGLSSDGAERSVFAPGIEGQLRAYERAYEEIDPGSIGYLEAHGTATRTGDAAEIESLDRFFGPTRGGKLPIGSVKALVGHTLTAAGMVSIVKCLDVLQHGVVPPHVPIRQADRLGGTCLTVPVAPRRMERPRTAPLRVGISSFGFGGSNAHLVLQQPASPTARGARARGAASQVHRLRLVDFEVAVGDRIGRSAFCAAGPPAAGPPDAGRFASFSAEDLDRLGEGIFFPAEIEVPAGSMRLGPRMMAQIDPLQVLVSQLSAELVRRHGSWLDASRTGIAVSSNLGGEMALRISRHCGMPADRAGEDPLGGDLQIEHIASGMPSMCSGYPAATANLRGFHATYSGGELTFLRLLEMVDYWLDHRSDAVIIGAARSIKSVLDLRATRGLAGGMQGEAVGLLLFSRDDATAPPPLATLSLATVGARAGALEALRDELAFPRDSASCLVHELGSFSEVPAGVDGGLGFLGEGAGLAALLTALTGPATRTAIDLRQRGRTVALAVVDRRPDAAAPPPVDHRPRTLPISFASGPPRRPSGTEPAAVASVRAAGPSEVSLLGRYLTLSAATVERSLRIGADLVCMLAAGGSGASRPGPVTVASRAPGTGLLTHVTGSLEAGGAVSAGVAVDTGDPYFFDHPLDHVPAVLLVEAACQLVAWVSPTGQPPACLDLSFPRFCDLDAPPTMRLQASGRGAALECTAVRHGLLVLKGRLQPDRGPLAAAAVAADGEPAQRVDPGRVHKTASENVFVGEPRKAGGGRWRCAVVLPDQAHTLRAAWPAAVSPTVLIEAFRQMSTLGAHELRGVERARTMTQLSFHARLERAIGHQERIVLEMAESQTKTIGEVEVANLTATVLVEGARLGMLRSRAFMASAETYTRLRKGST